MIICHCRVVNDKQIARAIETGARSVADICRATGAGSGCGSCVFALKGLLQDCDKAEQDTFMEVKRAAS